MLVHANGFSASTPCPSTSTSNTSEPTNTFNNSSSPQLNYNLHQLSSSLCSTLQVEKKQFMGCTSTIRRSSRIPSIMDSPTLARIERAKLRLEASTKQQILNNSSSSTTMNFNHEYGIEKLIVDPYKHTLLAGPVPISLMTGPIKRGLLWQQRDRIFSRWKERYFILTRDYLHCFKRASGSANERASDMGQFILKIKLVDVEKVEWLNRRSYSCIGLFLGREGKVLLRCDEGIEDWFELLEECTLTSKERRKTLKITQGPRSRASLAAPVSHYSLPSNHFGLGGTYSMTSGSAMGGIRCQNLVTSSICGYEGTNPFLYSDSVPDLSILNNENHNHARGVSTNHSTPQKILSSAYNISRNSENNSNYNWNDFSPQRILNNASFGSTQIVDEETEEDEVELRHHHKFRQLSTENCNELHSDWLYRRPKAPTDMRHSVQPLLRTPNNNSSNKIVSDLDCSALETGLDTSRSTSGHTLNSAAGTFRAKKSNHNHFSSKLNQGNALHISRHSVQDHILKSLNMEDFGVPTKSKNRLSSIQYDSNQNRCFKNGVQSSDHTPIRTHQTHSNNKIHQFQPESGNDNDNKTNNNNNDIIRSIHNGSASLQERYQHPALAAIINETQGAKFRGNQTDVIIFKLWNVFMAIEKEIYFL